MTVITGWHEARIPTIATVVPRAAFTWVTQKLKVVYCSFTVQVLIRFQGQVKIPLVTSNRINMPEVAEKYVD